MLAVDLFGADYVRAGDFMSPVYVTGIQKEDVEPAQQLLLEIGLELKVLSFSN